MLRFLRVVVAALWQDEPAAVPEHVVGESALPGRPRPRINVN